MALLNLTLSDLESLLAAGFSAVPAVFLVFVLFPLTGELKFKKTLLLPQYQSDFNETL